MKKRRDVKENNVIIFKNNNVKITKEPNQYLFFEIKKEITSDIAEAISLMIDIEDSELWEIELNKNINIDPEKCLYWLSGGDKEWLLLEHYNKNWVDCYLDFQEEFGFIIVEIIKNSKTLGDIRNGFIKYLNLPTLYDFAISKGFVKQYF